MTDMDTDTGNDTGNDTDRLRLHLLDDQNGFVETPQEVRRIKGSGLSKLAERLPVSLGGTASSLGTGAPQPPVDDPDMARLLEMLEQLRETGAPGAPSPAPRRDLPVRQLAVTGPQQLTGPFVAVADLTPGIEARHLGERWDPHAAGDEPPGLVVVATASLFDPWTARVAEWCVRTGRPHLVYGVARDAVTFVGPLWTPDRAGACYECLRVRVSSNSVHGPTWRAYMRLLAVTGGRPVQQELPPWAAAQLAGSVGRRVEQWLADPAADPADQLLWTDDSGAGESRRHLLAVPICEVCGGGPDSAPDPPEGIGLRAAEDDRVGIVHASSVRRAESGPPVYLSGSTSADFALIRPSMRVTRNGGAGFAKKEAIDAALGESLERYAAGIYRPRDLRTASFEELDEPAVRPGEFGLYSPEQYATPGFPFEPFDDTTRVRWTPARDLWTGERLWVPASQVYLHYRRLREEAAVAPSISTGLAAGPSFREAVLSGLYEIIERDALAVSWLHRLPPRPVADDMIMASSQVSYLIAGATSWRVRFYDLSLDLTPSCVVAVMEHTGGPDRIMSFGSACRWSPAEAVRKAFLEAAQGLTYVRRLLKQHEDWEAAEDFHDVDDFNKHAIFYSKYPELRERAGYLVHPTRPPACTRPERPAPADTRDPLDLMVKELGEAGRRVCVVDLTTPDVRQLGVHVVRVLVPGLQHLAGHHACRMLGGRRLREVVAALGTDSAPDNPFPHPLP